MKSWILLLGLLGICVALEESEWKARGWAALEENLNIRPNLRKAKNVILFIGDGMGLTTLTAGRIYKGQKAGEVGELAKFSFDDFPHLGLSKTFCNDHQVTESGAGAVALLTGTKVNFGMLGLSPSVVRGDCDNMEGNELDTIIDGFMDDDRDAGIVTTTRLTHATPGAAYSHSPDRRWEHDGKLPDDVRDAGICTDIAHQLMNREENKKLKVLMGGGRTNFFNSTEADEEYPTVMGNRQDGLDLIQMWKDDKVARGESYAYVWNETAFNDVDPEETDYLLGLFEPSNMQYELKRPDDPAGEPHLADMTEKAIKMLKKNRKGFFLLVEAGRIDHAHHDNKPKLAFEDTLALDEAVARAVDETDPTNTLIIVTSDHGIPLTMGSWAKLNNPILGFVDEVGMAVEPPTDGHPYLSLVYGNGAGPVERIDRSTEDTEGDDYRFPARVPMPYSSHGGEEVVIFAKGPWSHLVNGVKENQYISHVMSYAACVGPYKDACKEDRDMPVCEVEVGTASALTPGRLSALVLMLGWVLLRLAQ